MKQRLIAMAAAVLIAALGACKSAVSDVDDRSEKLTRKDWVAETINGAAVINPGKVTLSVIEGRVSGRAGCNLYSGPVEIGNGTLKIGALISTKMACHGDGVMQQESAYLKALGTATRYSFQAPEKLTISTSSGNIVYGGVARQERPDSP